MPKLECRPRARRNALRRTRTVIEGRLAATTAAPFGSRPAEGRPMDLDERRELFDVVRYRLSKILDRYIAALDDEATRKTLATRLAQLRERLLVPANTKPATFDAKWTPGYAEAIFAEYGAVLRLVAPDGSVLRRAGEELEKVLPLNQDATPDGGSRLDRLLEANVKNLWLAANQEYFAAYREGIRSRHSASVSSLTAVEFLMSQIRQTYEYARSLACDNDEVLGALVEAKFREIVRGLVTPLHVSSGAVAGTPDMKQIDIIIWSRQHGPPAIEIDDVAIVPPAAVRGLIEVKASCDSELAEFGQRVTELEAEQSAMQDIWELSASAPAFGVVLWSKFSPATVRARTAGAARSLFTRDDSGLTPNPVGLGEFLNFIRQEVIFVHAGKALPDGTP